LLRDGRGDGRGRPLTLSLEGEREGGEAEGYDDVDRVVVVECGSRRLEGHLHIDMPPQHRRVLDYLNRAEAFLPLYHDGRLQLVQKHNITRVIETGEA